MFDSQYGGNYLLPGSIKLINGVLKRNLTLTAINQSASIENLKKIDLLCDFLVSNQNIRRKAK